MDMTQHYGAGGVSLQRFVLWFGAFILAVGSIGLLVIGEFQTAVTICMLSGLSAISVSMWPYFGRSKPFSDERAARISAKAGLYSWYVTLAVTVFGAGVVSIPGLIRPPTTAQAVGGIVLVMVVTLVCGYEYMSRKGDEE